MVVGFVNRRKLFATVLATIVCDMALAQSSCWTADRMVGLRCELVDPVRIENYMFNKNGLVAVTIGTKEQYHASTLVIGESAMDDSRSRTGIPSGRNLCYLACATAFSPFAGSPGRSLGFIISSSTARPNQTMKPTAPLRYKFSVLATTPCRGLSPSRQISRRCKYA